MAPKDLTGVFFLGSHYSLVIYTWLILGGGHSVDFLLIFLLNGTDAKTKLRKDVVTSCLMVLQWLFSSCGMLLIDSNKIIFTPHGTLLLYSMTG